MLNEIKEFEEYTLSDEEIGKVKRLKKRTLIQGSYGNGKITSLRRPLTILARNCLFEKSFYYNVEDTESSIVEPVRKTINYLKSWLGDYIEDEDFDYHNKKVNCWLKKYFYNNVINELKEESESKESSQYENGKDGVCESIDNTLEEKIIDDQTSPVEEIRKQLKIIMDTTKTFEDWKTAEGVLLEKIKNKNIDMEELKKNEKRIIYLIKGLNKSASAMKYSGRQSAHNNINQYNYERIISNAFE